MFVEIVLAYIFLKRIFNTFLNIKNEINNTKICNKMSLYILNKDMLIKLIETIRVREREILKRVCVSYNLKTLDEPDYRKMNKKQLIETICNLKDLYYEEVEIY